MPVEHIVVQCAVPSVEDGEAIATALVEDRLAACVNLVPRIKSVYRWEGQVTTAPEVLLLIKTRVGVFPRLAARIRALHPYEVPELIALPVQAGSPDYLRWIDESTQ